VAHEQAHWALGVASWVGQWTEGPKDSVPKETERCVLMPPRTADSLDLITPRLVAWEKSEAAARIARMAGKWQMVTGNPAFVTVLSLASRSYSQALAILLPWESHRAEWA